MLNVYILWFASSYSLLYSALLLLRFLFDADCSLAADAPLATPSPLPENTESPLFVENRLTSTSRIENIMIATCAIEKKHHIDACSIRFGEMKLAMMGPKAKRKKP